MSFPGDSQSQVPGTLPTAELFEQEFLTLRCKILELAAALDRVDRGEGSVAEDPRTRQLKDAIQILLSENANRAEQVQMVFSDAYQDKWFDEFEKTP